MAHPLLLLGMLVASSVGSSGYLLRSAAQDPKLTPRIWADPAKPDSGWNARYLMGGIGLASVVFGSMVPFFGPAIAAAGVGMAIGALNNADTVAVIDKGLGGVIKAYLAEHPTLQITQTDPATGAPVVVPATQIPDAGAAPSGSGSWLDMILSPFMGQPAAA